MNKKQYGQFYTTNYSYIFNNIDIPKKQNFIEPFAGNGDLLNLLDNNVEAYDIDPKKENIVKRDTLLNPPNYNNKYVITNPPYLARNKCRNKEYFDKYNTNDLYKAFIKSLIVDPPNGGIIIIPLNFWCSIRKNDIQLRKDFIFKFKINKMNIFEEKVFDDTTYTICCFQFEKNDKIKSSFNCIIYPNKTSLKFKLDKINFLIGGQIYHLPQDPNIKITRLTRENKNEQNTFINLKTIDDNSNSKIKLEMVSKENIYIDNTTNLSARSFANLIIKPSINYKQQEKLCYEFNKFLNKKRKKYYSLFLTNYRESKDIARKRISFNLVYQIVNYLISTKIKNH